MDPFERCELDGVEVAPRTPAANDFRLDEPDHAFRERVVVAVADAAYGRFDPGLGQALGILDRDVLDAADDRIRARFRQAQETEEAIEMKFSIADGWSRQRFIALCRRYALRPFRYRRMHRQTIIFKALKSFIEGMLWPEFEELNAALTAYLAEITERVIREEVHGEIDDAEEVDANRQIGPFR